MFYRNASWRKIYVPCNSLKSYQFESVFDKNWNKYALDIVGYDF
jgi:hypothetical protein